MGKNNVGNKDANLSSVLRLDIQEMGKNNVFNIKESDLKKYKILVRESEFIRVLKCFNPNNTIADEAGYSFVSDMVVFKIGKSHKKYEEKLCIDFNNEIEQLKIKSEPDLVEKIAELESLKGVITLNIITIIKDENGKDIKKIKSTKYKRILCGSSAVRNTKEFFINEELYDKVMEVFLTGIPVDAQHPSDKFSKYSSYLALVSTDSKALKKIPNICVVDDYETKVSDIFDTITQTINTIDGNKHISYDVEIGDKETEENIKPFDGAGLVDYELAKEWAEELGLNYVPSSWQIRVLNGIKGNLYTFPLSEFKETFPDVKMRDDVWENEIKDFNSKQVVLTESMFKFKSKYSSFDEWYNAFITPVNYKEYEYNRTFNISAYSESIDELTDELVTAYQPLQTLSLSDNDIKELCEPTVKRIRDVHTSIIKFIKYRGLERYLDGEDNKKDKITPSYYKGLAADPSLQYDPFVRQKIKEDLKSLKYKAYTGKLFLEGCYQTAIPDVLGLAQYIFNMDVVGALQKGEVYCNYWDIKKKTDISIWRNPHIACEWFTVKVVQNDNTKWFKYQDTGIVTDIYSTLPLRLGTMDFDGDHIASISSKIIYNAIEAADIHTIRFVEAKQEKDTELLPINNIDKIIHTNALGFQNNIGECTNKVTTLWGIETKTPLKKEQVQNNIKILSVVNQLIIDFVKTGEKVPIPSEIIKMVKNHKQPYFMRFKNSNNVDDDTIDSFGVLFDVDSKKCEESKKYAWTNGTMDRICKHLMKNVEDIEVEFDNAGTTYFNFLRLYDTMPYVYNATYPKVKDKLIQLQSEHDLLCNKNYKDENTHTQRNENSLRFRRFYSYCKNELLLICPDTKKLLNYMVYAHYMDKVLMRTHKSILWNTFGNEFISRLKMNNLKSESVNYKSVDVEKLLEKKDKLQKDINKATKDCNVVKIEEISNEKDVVIYQSELKSIRKQVSYVPAQKLFLILLVLQRKHNVDSTKFTPVVLSKGKKSKVTLNQLCKLADIYNNQTKKCFDILRECHLITVDLKKNAKQPKIICNINNSYDGKQYKIGDINECRELCKLFK